MFRFIELTRRVAFKWSTVVLLSIERLRFLFDRPAELCNSSCFDDMSDIDIRDYYFRISAAFINLGFTCGKVGYGCIVSSSLVAVTKT